MLAKQFQRPAETVWVPHGLTKQKKKMYIYTRVSKHVCMREYSQICQKASGVKDLLREVRIDGQVGLV